MIRTDQPGLLIQEVAAINAGRYRIITFPTGTTTNNGDGSISVTAGTGGFGFWTLSGSNLYSPTADTVTVGTSSTSYDTFTVNAGSGGETINGIFAGVGGIDANTLLMLHMDGTNGSTTFTDSSLTPKTATANGGAKISTAQSVFGGASGSFTAATPDYLTIPNSTDVNFGSGDFTLEARVRSPDNSFGAVVAKLNYGAGQAVWNFYVGNTVLELLYTTDGSTLLNKQVAWSPSANTWYWVVVRRTGNNLQFFVDGVQQGATQSLAGVTFFSGTSNMTIGGDGTGTGDSFNGFIDELRISNISRTIGATPSGAYTTVSTTPTLTFASQGSTLAQIQANSSTSNLDFINNGIRGIRLNSSGSATIRGTTTNDSAAAAFVGEYISASVVQGSAVALTTATPKTVTSISLTAGDWDVTGIGALTGASTGTVFDVAIGTTTNSLAGTVLGDTRCQTPTVSLTGADASLMIPAARVSLTSTTTYYLIVQETFTVGTPSAYGRLSARRVR